MKTSRRTFLGQAALGGSLIAHDGLASMLGLAPPPSSSDREFLGVVPFGRGGRRRSVLNQPYGKGLRGRLRSDLSTLDEESLLTPVEHFYIRTRCPEKLDTSIPWRIRVRGLVERERELRLEDLLPRSKPQGVHLMECSGSGTSGLISACDWRGIPIEDVLALSTPKGSARRIAIAGYDQHERVRRGYDERGCDWIFTEGQLREAGAFLATHMNGERINRDHGFPVRLIVPGWYGCTCVKWLDEITWTDDDVPATRHMTQFARRTLQRGRPKLAREFEPARIDLSAMPVRVEKWRAGARIEYDVIGIVWGGRKTADRLALRFGDGPAEPVTDFVHRTTRTWNLWRHTWRPPAAGSYRIRCSFPAAGQPTRKVESGSFDRRIAIDAV